uniref:Uncharacterized protein n=1 Tax=Anguilla anguilla TaxID=7936 RepID=A0A0E9RGV1_ANGAN
MGEAESCLVSDFSHHRINLMILFAP